MQLRKAHKQYQDAVNSLEVLALKENPVPASGLELAISLLKQALQASHFS